MCIIAYLRVSTGEQSCERQLEAIKQANYEPQLIFSESASASNAANLLELKKMITCLRSGDIVVVESISRISRRTADLFDLLKTLNEKNVRLVSVSQNFDFTTTTGKLMLAVLGAVAELERDLILERQRYGIEKARREGKYKGRQPIKRPSNFDDCFEKWKNATQFNKYTIKDFGKETGLRPGTLRKFFIEKINIEKMKKEWNKRH